MDPTSDAVARACEFMKATFNRDYHADGCFSLVFIAGNEEYQLSFGIPGNLAMLSTNPPSPSSSLVQFIFECNAITFHPRATQDGFMLFFHTAFGRVMSPKLLVAGDARGVNRLIQYSLAPVETEGELEFPRQL